MLKYEQSELRRINTACQEGLSLGVERSSNNQLHGRNWDKKRCTRCTGDSCFPLVDTWVCIRRCKNICGIHLGETQHKTNEGQNESVKCAPQSLDSVDCVHVCNEWSSFTRKTVSMFVALFYEWYRTAFSFHFISIENFSQDSGDNGILSSLSLDCGNVSFCNNK